MRRHFKKARIYQTPSAKVTQMALERCFCNTNRFNIQVDELHNMNMEVEESKRDTPEDPFYFEF